MLNSIQQYVLCMYARKYARNNVIRSTHLGPPSGRGGSVLGVPPTGQYQIRPRRTGFLSIQSLCLAQAVPTLQPRAVMATKDGGHKPLKTILKSSSGSALHDVLCRTAGHLTDFGEELGCFLPPRPRSKSDSFPMSFKKSVRFADSHGLALEQVLDIKGHESPRSRSRIRQMVREKSLQFTGPQPSACEAFMEKVRKLGVCLENVATRGMGVLGVVRVLNLSYEKTISVRWTADNWGSFQDIEAMYATDSSDGHSDLFVFQLKVPDCVEAGEKIQFAIRFRPAGHGDYWDNNDCKNYSLECHTQWKKDELRP